MTESELMLLLESNPEIACMVNDMIPKAKKIYVDSRHEHAIYRLSVKNKYRDGHYCTRIYVDGKRKVVEKATEEDLYDYLFEYYKALDDRLKNMEQVFEMFVEDKRSRAVTEKTINEYRRYFGFLPSAIKKKRLIDITEEDIRKWLTSDYLKNRPKKEALKKMLQIISMVFKFGIRRRLCIDNPMLYIQAQDYYKLCDLSTKSNEERSFSPEDIERIRTYALEHATNPHAVMILVAIETGMRAGELAALCKDDIQGDTLHIHRQLTKIPKSDTNASQFFVNVEYTKNERMNPHGGRPLPISDDCRKALDIALKLPGESDFLFHNDKGEQVNTDNYCRYLRRACKRLGIPITNNHAFRVAFNARLIAAGVDGNERCLILGHSMQTNERHYSFGDKRRIEDVRNKLNMCKIV